MKTLKIFAFAFSIFFCAACAKNSEQASSPTSPEDQVVPADSSDRVMDTTTMNADTTSLRR